MIQLGIFLAAENPVNHRPVASGHRQGRINIVIYSAGCVVALESTKGQIVVPGDHRKLSVILVKIVVVDHGTGIAIPINHKVVNHKIADYRFRIHSTFLALTQILQGRNQPGLIRSGDIGLGTAEDGGIAVGVIVDILQLGFPGAHTTGYHTAHLRGIEPALLSSTGAGIGRCLSTLLFPGTGLPGHHTAHLGRIKAFRHGGHFRRIAAHAWPHSATRHTGHCAAGRIFTVGRSHKIFKIKILAVAPAATHIHAVRLVQIAVVIAVIALQEAFFYCLHCQIQPPALAIDGDIHITA